jgi:hypothetical protein
MINDECYSYIQLVTPNVVAIAVKILMMTLMIVFHVSALTFSLMILRNFSLTLPRGAGFPRPHLA